jgi:hypothetical protein
MPSAREASLYLLLNPLDFLYLSDTFSPLLRGVGARALIAWRAMLGRFTHVRQFEGTSMHRMGFEPTIPAFERKKTVGPLDRAATVIAFPKFYITKSKINNTPKITEISCK